MDPAKVAELRAAFNCFDKDNSGSIDRSELLELMSSLGIDLSDDVRPEEWGREGERGRGKGEEERVRRDSGRLVFARCRLCVGMICSQVTVSK